ncbi:hypothetical protein M2164_008097 [Streptomyces sp. SAI-208]|uniref:hypothetical protein n=1 Tax=unclassified Streptomyces TaxID=2593676 RepID=UPI002476A20F|nr:MULTISPECIES: hypothetical protein [unclassified Streptomyces]MDH6521451.1 hypothetical protein [Streptomyces sp. SAI-090]MDH6553687.1 hypothetical protein [Streptomyces sp. SAI-041]MDH6572766.1 hypothetical protein [Streptomyces sp. SAI-117]MDH6582272.1 hypothetical protein [Streptomyces sp. SAI-133]MDH6612462.1 hypothetical protein [Streptomyces sp. SAI-208]
MSRSLGHARSTTSSLRRYATVVRLRGSFGEGPGGRPGSVDSLTALVESVAAQARGTGLGGRSKG